MPEIAHPSRVGPPPSEEEVKTAQTVYGRSAAGFAHNLGALLGARFKRAFCVPVEMADITEDNSTAATLETEIPVLWRLSPEADRIYVGIWCVAEPNQSSPPSVTVEIYTESGVLVDAGAAWSEANGLLPVSPARVVLFPVPVGVVTSYGVLAGQDHYIETGWMREEPAAAGGGVRTLGGEDPGLVVELRVTLSGVRAYSINVIEAISGHLLEP